MSSLALAVVRALAVLGLRRLHRPATLRLVDGLLRLVVVRREPDGGRGVRLRDVAAVPGAEHADRRGRVARLQLNGLRVCIGALVVLGLLTCDLRRVRAVARARLGLVDRLLRLVAVRRESDGGRGVRLRDVAVVARAQHADRRGRVARALLHSLRVRVRGLAVGGALTRDLRRVSRARSTRAALRLVDRLLRLVAVQRRRDRGGVVRLRDVATVPGAEHADRGRVVLGLPLHRVRICVGGLPRGRILTCDLRRIRAVARTRLGLVDRLLRLVAVRSDRAGGHRVRLGHVTVVTGAENADREGVVARCNLNRLRVGIRRLRVPGLLAGDLCVVRAVAAAGLRLVGALTRGVAVRGNGACSRRVGLRDRTVIARAENADGHRAVRRPILGGTARATRRLPARRGLTGSLPGAPTLLGRCRACPCKGQHERSEERAESFHSRGAPSVSSSRGRRPRQ